MAYARGEKVEARADFLFLGSEITVDNDCSHEIKRCLLLRRKAMTNLDSILKSRDITLTTKAHLVKSMVFLEVMYGCESSIIKRAEHRRIDAFEPSRISVKELGFPGGSGDKESSFSAGGLGLIPG